MCLLAKAEVCVFTTFHAIIGKKDRVELFYKVRNGWY